MLLKCPCWCLHGDLFHTEYDLFTATFHIRKGTVQRRLYENNRNSTTRSHFKGNGCLKVHNAHLKLPSPIEIFRNCTKLTMLSILYFFVVKGKLISAKSLSPVGLEHQHLRIFTPKPLGSSKSKSLMHNKSEVKDPSITTWGSSSYG